MRISLNGEQCDIADGTTVVELLRLRGARERGSAVAVDGDVVPRGEWDQCVLSDGQTVELVHAVQGG
jgi:sulfur carrier protein